MPSVRKIFSGHTCPARKRPAFAGDEYCINDCKYRVPCDNAGFISPNLDNNGIKIFCAHQGDLEKG